MKPPVSEPIAAPIAARVHGELFAAVALAIGVFVLYWPSATVEFVRLDDWQYVVDNPLVRSPSWQGVARVFSEVRKPSTVDGYYQPLTMASLMLDGMLSGPDAPSPFVFRLTNVFWHALASIAVMLILREAVGGIWIPLVCAALFAAHPVQVESVAWISQRKTVLSGFLALSATWGYLRYRRTNQTGWMIAATGLFALAVLSKPTTVLIPLTWPLLDRWPLRMNSNWRALSPVLAIMVVAGFVAWLSQAGSGAAVATPRLSRVAPVALAAIGQYAGNLLWPMELSPYREIRGITGWSDPMVIGAAIGLVVLFVTAWCLRKRAPAAWVALICFLMFLAPAVGIVRFDETIVADRFLYLPIVFALLPIAAIASWSGRQSPRHAGWAAALTACFIIPLGALNRAQQGVWQDSLALWTHVASVCPHMIKAQYELAVIKLELGMPEQALTHAQNTLYPDNTNSQHHFVYGRALIETGDDVNGEKMVKFALSLGLGPQEPWAHMALARVNILRKDAAAARDCITRAQATGDVDASEYAVLADAAWRKANLADFAVELYDMAIARGGPEIIWRWNRGGALEQAGRDNDALAAYDDVLGEFGRARALPPPEFVQARTALARRIAASQPTTQPGDEPRDDGK